MHFRRFCPSGSLAVLAAAIAALVVFSVPSAWAEGNCPDGMFPIGGGNAGWEGCAPMGPSGEDYSEPAFDPVQNQIDVANGLYELERLKQTREAELQKDPNYRAWKTGGWNYFQSVVGAEKGEYCTALFAKGDTMVSIAGPGGNYRGALLSFYTLGRANGIPAPKTPRMISVKLTQNAYPPSKVKVYNYSRGDGIGVISFAVPTLEAAIGGMEDEQSFKLEYKGKTITNVKWSGGLGARDELRACANP
jgi:hypothetical protein